MCSIEITLLVRVGGGDTLLLLHAVMITTYLIECIQSSFSLLDPADILYTVCLPSTTLPSESVLQAYVNIISVTHSTNNTHTMYTTFMTSLDVDCSSKQNLLLFLSGTSHILMFSRGMIPLGSLSYNTSNS